MTHHGSIQYTQDGERGIHMYIHEPRCRCFYTSYVQVAIALLFTFIQYSADVIATLHQIISHDIMSAHVISYNIISAPSGQETLNNCKLVFAYSPANAHDLSQMTVDRKQ